MTNCTALVPVVPFDIIPRHLSPTSWIEIFPRALDTRTNVQSPSLMYSRDRGRFRQMMPYHDGVIRGTSADGGAENPLMRGGLRLHGTYTMDGKLVTTVVEKGTLLDCLG